MIIFVDMDGVLADYDKRARELEAVYDGGLECHADVNAARNLVSRRSWDGKASEPLTKRGILHRQLRLHVERQTRVFYQGASSGSGIHGDAADRLLENPYLRDSMKREVMSKWNDHAFVVSEVASST